MASRLSPLQMDFLEAFFRHESRFFLTGGAALVGFHLHHRSTRDLDFFATANHLDEGDGALVRAASEIGATVENLQTSPEFRRRLVRKGDDAVVVDLVHDRTPQLVADKPLVGNIRVDTPGEILANKLCALLSRAEIRDLVDVRALEAAGYGVEAALPAAMRKDGGLTPAQLAWVLSQIEIPAGADVPGEVEPEELARYARALRARLARLAFPADPGPAAG